MRETLINELILKLNVISEESRWSNMTCPKRLLPQIKRELEIFTEIVGNKGLHQVMDARTQCRNIQLYCLHYIFSLYTVIQDIFATWKICKCRPQATLQEELRSLFSSNPGYMDTQHTTKVLPILHLCLKQCQVMTCCRLGLEYNSFKGNTTTTGHNLTQF